MKTKCNVIRDIMPLYLEDIASEDSRTLVEDHVEQCHECKECLTEMKSNVNIAMDTNITPLTKIKSVIRKKKMQIIVFSVMLSIVIGIIAIAFLTAPEYIPYSDNRVQVYETHDGTVIAVFEEAVGGYEIDQIDSTYHITTWNSIWSKYIRRANINSAVLNPNNEKVYQVYYYQTNGAADMLIYGNKYSVGGVVTLPRLVLAYYLQLALLLVVICGIIMAIFRKHKKVTTVLRRIIYFPISHIVGILLIKGIDTTSYHAARDFYAIVLVTIFLYFAFLAAESLIKHYRKES